MPVMQVSLDVSQAVFDGLMSGDYTRHGGVVRGVGGAIVTHLQDADVPDVITDPEVRRRAVQALLSRNGLIAIGIGVAVAGGGVAYLALKKRKNQRAIELEASESVVAYNRALAAYLEAVRDGALTEELLDNLVAALDTVQISAHEGSISIDFSGEQARTLVNMIVDYTRQLAEANEFVMEAPEASEPGSMEESVVDLRHYLQIQKQIFKRAS